MPSPQDYRNLELDHAAATAVARGSTTLGAFLKVGVPLGAVGLAAFMIYQSLYGPKGSTTNPDREEFRTTQYPAPHLEAPRTQVDTGRFTVPPPEPAPHPPPLPPIAPPVASLAPPFAPPDDGEARRLAELERQRREEEERRKWERLRAPQVVADNADASMSGRSGGDNPNTPRAPTEREEDPNRRFLASAGSAGVEVSTATKNNRIDALIAQGTFIRGILETAIQSDLPGMVRAVTTENVWSFDGRRVLIPAGSRLIGEYKSGIAQGQTRVFIVWTRLLRSDGVSVQLASIGTDSLGRSGSSGTVDNHYLERYGSAVLLSLVGGISQFIAGLGQSSQSQQGRTITVTDPVTGQTSTTTIQPDGTLGNARQIGAQQVSQTLTNLANEALKNSINIPPTIHINQGAAITVFVRRDLDFSLFYPDPIREALSEIKAEMKRGPAPSISTPTGASSSRIVK
ncbi:MAG: type IV secretion system protein VirB10 [Cupriavidus sp.]|nr:type IV secretion system protein VirB10 [Cupriavidus sp.]MCA3704351.1 type IV secretion system protein VirB10 [Methylobacterium sp.]